MITGEHLCKTKVSSAVKRLMEVGKASSWGKYASCIVFSWTKSPISGGIIVSSDSIKSPYPFKHNVLSDVNVPMDMRMGALLLTPWKARHHARDKRESATGVRASRT